MKKLICLLVVLAALTVGVCAAWEDVPEGHWAADAITEMAEQGIVNGFPDGTFHPDDTLTRAQFLAMVVRAALPEEAPEPDADHDWWWNTMELAENSGLLWHVYWEPNRASMDVPIPRQEAADILNQVNERWNGLYITDVASVTPFRDIQGSAYYTSILSASAQGLLEGYPDGNFRPNGTLTRAEGCVMVQRLLDQAKLLAEGETQVLNTGVYLIKHRFLDDGSAVLTSIRQSDGKVIQTMEVPMDGYDGMAEMRQESPDLWNETFGRRFDGAEGDRFWGLMGYYTYDGDGHFTQITDRAVFQWTEDPTGGILILSFQPGTRVTYSGGGLLYQAGNEVLRIKADGTVETVLSNTPAHGLNLTAVAGEEDGTVRVVHLFYMGMADLHCYEYAVENGKLRAVVHEPGDGYSGYTEEEAKTEQARLDAAGCGVGST